jgi:hypothetical protein
MNPNPVDTDKTVRGWRLLADIVQPIGWQDERWLTAGLTAVLAAIQLPAAELERLKIAAAEAAARAEPYAVSDQARQPLVVRVLISSPVAAGTAPCSWGFFVIERAAGETDFTGADADRLNGPPRAHRIEVYLYADAGSG